MKHRARPSSHTRLVKTKKGRKKVKINRHIKKKVKKRSGIDAELQGILKELEGQKSSSKLQSLGQYKTGQEILYEPSTDRYFAKEAGVTYAMPGVGYKKRASVRKKCPAGKAWDPRLKKCVKCPGGRIRSQGLGRGLGTGKGKGPIGGLGTGRRISRSRAIKAASGNLDVQDAMYYLDIKDMPGMKKESTRVLDVIQERNPFAVTKARKILAAERGVFSI